MISRRLMMSAAILSMPFVVFGAADFTANIAHLVTAGPLRALRNTMDAYNVRLKIYKGILNKVEHVVAPVTECGADQCAEELRFLKAQTDDIQAYFDEMYEPGPVGFKFADLRGLIDQSHDFAEQVMCEKKGNLSDCFAASVELNGVYRAFCREYRDELANNEIACQHFVNLLESRKNFVTKLAGKVAACHLKGREIGVHAPITSIAAMLADEEQRGDAFIHAMKTRNWEALPE